MPPPGAWEAFDTSTEAGRTLKKLYGNSAGHPNIEYPKLTTRATKPGARKAAFIPGGARFGHSDARTNTGRREVQNAVAAPRTPRRARRACKRQ